MKIFKYSYLLVMLMISGCGGTSLTPISSCIPETYIQSTNNVPFYIIAVGNKIPYSSLSNEDEDDNYLSFSGPDIYYERNKVKIHQLDVGAKVLLDGFAIKLEKWGMDAWVGSYPTTWFSVKYNNMQIWISHNELKWMFEDIEFKRINIEAYNILQFTERLPPKIAYTYDSDGKATEKSIVRYNEQTENKIQNFRRRDCGAYTY